MPVRTIPKNYRNVTGIAASSRAGGAAQFESTLERDFLALLEFSPDVKRNDICDREKLNATGVSIFETNIS